MKVAIYVEGITEAGFVFHPYAKLENIFQSIGKSYSKHWREIKEIVFKLKWTDFEALYNSGKCLSFRDFYDSVFI